MLIKGNVFIELNSNSIMGIVNAVTLLKNNNIDFQIIEKPNFKPVQSIDLTDNYQLNKQLGRKGLDVLRLLSEGYNYQTIADKLDISVDGTRYYVKKIFGALKVNNGRDAVRIYLTEIKK